MAYQAENPWLRAKPVGNCRRLLPGRHLNRCASPSGDYALKSWIFVERPGGALTRSRNLRIPDLKFLSTLFCLGPIGLASGAGSVALPTSFGGNGPHLKEWLVMLLSAPDAQWSIWAFYGAKNNIFPYSVNMVFITVFCCYKTRLQ